MSSRDVYWLLFSLAIGCGGSYLFFTVLFWLGPDSAAEPPRWLGHAGLALLFASLAYARLTGLRWGSPASSGKRGQ